MNIPKVLLGLVFACISIKTHTTEFSAESFYSGLMSSIKFNDEGSFWIQLSKKSIHIHAGKHNCTQSSAFLVKKDRQKIKYEKLNRMRNDVKDIFLSNKKLKVTLSVYGCDQETGYPLVSNIILGEWTF